MKIKKASIQTDRLNSERIINTLREKNVEIGDVKKDTNNLSFDVFGDNVDRCIECLENKNIEYKITSKRDMTTIKKFAFCQLVLGFWTILYIFVTLFICSFCYWVEIDAPSKNTQILVDQIIKEQGLDKAFLKRRFDNKNLEKIILERINNSAYVDISMEGSKLNVSVREQHQEPSKPVRYNKIISSCDCVVERILVTSGTAVVKEGDRVVKGQLLIDGYIDTLTPDDPANVRQPVEASGVVYGRVWKSKRLRLADEYIVAVQTGAKKVDSSINLFGWKWKKQQLPPFANYQTTSTTKRFGNFFPIEYNKTVYHEVKYVQRKVDENYIQSQIDSAQMDMLADLGENAKPIRTWNFQKRLDKIYILDIYYEIEMPINVGGE